MPDHLGLPIELILECHDLSLSIGGGVAGIKNEADLLSAIGRPFHELLGNVPYPTVIDKAGCLLHSLSSCHGFNDGNKRTAWIVSNGFLYVHDYVLDLPDGYKWYEKLALMIHEKWEVQDVIVWVKKYAKHDPDGKEQYQTFRMEDVLNHKED